MATGRIRSVVVLFFFTAYNAVMSGQQLKLDSTSNAMAIAGADLSNIQVEVKKLSECIYMLVNGEGGNLVVCVGDDGIVLVDTQTAPLAGKIRQAIRNISDKPVRFVINTHYHGDHTGGNALFQAQEHAFIIAQSNTRKRLASGGICGNGTSTEAVWPSADITALPGCTFDNAITLHLSGEDICVLYMANAHTDGDAVVLFRKANVVHMGDLFVTGATDCGFPFIDIYAGGSVCGMITGIERLLPQILDDTQIIPGHGPVSTKWDVKNYLQMLKGTSDAVAKAKAQGKTLERIKQEKILIPWKEWKGYYDADKYLETVYNDVSKAKPENLPAGGR